MHAYCTPCAGWERLCRNSWVAVARFCRRQEVCEDIKSSTAAIAYLAVVVNAINSLFSMGGKVDVATGADDPRRQGKEDKAKQVGR